MPSKKTGKDISKVGLKPQVKRQLKRVEKVAEAAIAEGTPKREAMENAYRSLQLAERLATQGREEEGREEETIGRRQIRTLPKGR